MIKIKKRNSGFIALITVIILSAVLITVTFTMNMSSIFSGINVLDSESKEMSLNAAEACTDTAISDFLESLPIPASINNGGDTCNIVLTQADTPAIGKIFIKTQSVVNKSYTNLKIIFDTNNLSVDSWEECPDFTNSTTSC